MTRHNNDSDLKARIESKLTQEELRQWEANIDAINYTKNCIKDLFGFEISPDYYPVICGFNTNHLQNLTSPVIN